MKKKLELKKEVVARLSGDQMGQMMGGTNNTVDRSRFGLCTTSCLGGCETKGCGSVDSCDNSCGVCYPEEATNGKSCDCPAEIYESQRAECWP